MLVCIGYYVGARVGFALTLSPVPVSTLWPPNAILLGALVLAPTRWWWVVLLSALPAHLLVELGSGIPLPMVLCWFISNSTEALIGAGGIRLLHAGPFRLDSFRQVALFLLFPALLAPFLSSFLDAGFVALNQYGDEPYWQLWFTRFFSNVTAELTVAPAIITLGTRPLASLRPRSEARLVEVALLGLGLLSVCVTIFTGLPAGPHTEPPLLYAPLPLLLWAAVRFGPAGISTSLLTFALLAIWGATRGLGPFVSSSPHANALSVQLFLIITAIPLLTLAATMQERRQAETRARRDEERLSLTLSAAQMGTWEWHPAARDGSWSDRTREILGASTAEPTIRRLLHLVVPEDRPLLTQAMRRPLQPGGFYDVEFRVMRPNGMVRWVRGSATAVLDQNRRSIRVLGVTADITEWKQTLRAVQESETRFRRVFDMGIVPMGFWHADGQITDANDAYLRLTGFTRAEMDAGLLRWDRLTAPEFRHLDNMALHELSTQGHCPLYEKEYLLRDGRRLPIQIGAGLLGPDHGIFAGIDLTERKRAERELEDRLRFEQLLSDFSATFATARDTRADDQIAPWLARLGEFLDVHWVSVSRLSPNHHTLQLAYTWTAPGVSPLPENLWVREFESAAHWVVAGRTVTIEDCRNPQPGKPLNPSHAMKLGVGALLSIPLIASGSVFGAVTFVAAQPRAWPQDLVQRLRLVREIFSNVLTRKALEGDRRQAEAVNTAILASLPGRTAILDRTGQILRVNEDWARNAHDHPIWFDGAGSNSNLLTTCRQAAAAGDALAKQVFAGLDAVLCGSRREFSLTYPLFTDDGDARWYDLLVQRLARREGGAVISRFDCTARKRAEIEADRNRAELAHILRVATMGELTASLVHELSQPLTAIRSNAQAGSRMLAHPEYDVEEIRSILSDIVANDRRASEILARIRKLVRKGELEFAPVDLNDLAREVVRLVETDTVLRGASATLDLAEGVAPVWGDRIQLQQVVLNLILNGLEAMTGTERTNRFLTIRTGWQDGSNVRFAVQDTGSGIPPDRLNHIFDPFYTSKPEGLGMGLSIARTIVHAHGGHMWAANNSDGGATVGFVVPATVPSR